MNRSPESVGTQVDAAKKMKDRLRADLEIAMLLRRALEAKVIRTLIAAIDNAEAPPVQTEHAATIQHLFHDGSAEVERLLLSEADVRQVLMMDIAERERAAEELGRLGITKRAQGLRKEILLAKRYLA